MFITFLKDLMHLYICSYITTKKSVITSGKSWKVIAVVKMSDFLSVPTGSGKCLIFEVAPFFFDFLQHGQRQKVVSTCICLVVVPLVTLMKDQMASMCTRGISAISVGADCSSKQLQEITDGKYSLVFGSPEAPLNTCSHQSIF